jgi:retron-type reverse transcriptase
VLAVEIPKPHGGATRLLGVPTISDTVAQTVVARRLEAKVEPIFHPDFYGYRPARSALDAVAAWREPTGAAAAKVAIRVRKRDRASQADSVTCVILHRHVGADGCVTP